MLRKYSTLMVVLLVAASLIGITSIHQYIEGQPQITKRTVQLQGQVISATISSGAESTCTASVKLPADKPNAANLPPGTSLTLKVYPIESCTFFGLAKIGETPIQFKVPEPRSSTQTQHTVIQVIL
jgi:hypothetical protein